MLLWICLLFYLFINITTFPLVYKFNFPISQQAHENKVNSSSLEGWADLQTARRCRKNVVADLLYLDFDVVCGIYFLRFLLHLIRIYIKCCTYFLILMQFVGVFFVDFFYSRFLCIFLFLLHTKHLKFYVGDLARFQVMKLLRQPNFLH